MTKYVVLIYQGTTPLPGSQAWQAMSGEQQRSIYADYEALGKTPGMLPGLPLGLPEAATTVKVVGGKPEVTKGTFVPKAQAIGGYFVLEAENLDHAIAIAAKIPAARLGGAIEIRPAEVYW